jgi:hypothetical protein
LASLLGADHSYFSRNVQVMICPGYALEFGGSRAVRVGLGLIYAKMKVEE